MRLNQSALLLGYFIDSLNVSYTNPSLQAQRIGEQGLGLTRLLQGHFQRPKNNWF